MSRGFVVEMGRMKGGYGRARQVDRASVRLVACLSARVVGRKYQGLQSAGDMAGGQRRFVGAAVAVADGRVLGWAEEVFDGITSIFELREEEIKAGKTTTRLTEVSSLPGSPNDDRQEISSLPRGRTAPGSCCTGIFGGLISLRI
jgi:hypothetical protein